MGKQVFKAYTAQVLAGLAADLNGSRIPQGKIQGFAAKAEFNAFAGGREELEFGPHP